MCISPAAILKATNASVYSGMWVNIRIKLNINNRMKFKKMKTENDEEYIDKGIYKYNEHLGNFEKIVPSEIKKVPVINDEVIVNISAIRNVLSKKLPLRPELSVVVTILINAGLESNVDDLVNRVKSLYKKNYG